LPECRGKITVPQGWYTVRIELFGASQVFVLAMMFRRHRHRRWVAFLALVGLLFQQLAMATYLCPQEMAALAVPVVADSTDVMSPCHASATADPARCHEHCHPSTASVDHAPPPSVPSAWLPVTTWMRDGSRMDRTHWTHRWSVREQPPPLTIQHCTFQI
jgi:hypothetical protein